jgi:dipeptidyl aminopeptidase/acylaminoacyl peptidase
MRIFLVAILSVLVLNRLAAQKELFTEDHLWKLRRLSGTSVSPDEKWAFYQTTSYDVAANRGKNTGFLYETASGKTTVVFNEGTPFRNVVWDDSGRLIWLSDEDGGTRIKAAKPNGKTEDLGSIPAEADGFLFSRDLHYLVALQPVKVRKTATDANPDLPKTSGMVIDDLMYRHWNAWQGETALHLFLYEKTAGGYVARMDIMENESFASVTPPFSGIDDVAFSADGKTVYYSTKKLSGKEFAQSTNSEIYAFRLDMGTSIPITSAKGYDTHPSISPDGKQLAWLSMSTDGFESDRNRLMVRDLTSGTEREITLNTDVSVESFDWHPKSNLVYFTAAVKGTKQVFEADLSKKTVRQLTNERCDIVAIEVMKDRILAERQSMVAPTDLWEISTKNGAQKQLTKVNEDIMSKIALPEVMEKWVTTTDGKKMLVWVIAPPNFDASEKYPALLYCQGGPQSPVSQYFSYRWNFLLMASHGYVVMAPNRRGLPGFGQEWNDAISKDWGGQAMRDYLVCTDSVSALPFIDKNRLGAVGASYGGYSVYYLAGIHGNRFKTFISHCGLFNLESWYGTTEELFFANHDIGGAYWLPGNRELYEKNSPHKMVDKWNTPMLVIHGGKDFRVPESEGMQAFQVLQLKGIPSRFLYFPDEGHWVTKPQNSMLWNRTFFGWLDSYLK